MLTHSLTLVNRFGSGGTGGVGRVGCVRGVFGSGGVVRVEKWDISAGFVSAHEDAVIR